ncbi:MAG: hypothetical protein J6C98_02255 [Oscillospiraceae bacterium]|nr:hypothetical protein [Oscillospiraceae bacterium]
MKNRKPFGLIAVILPLTAAILMAAPNAVLMRFFDGENTIYKYVSGFSMLSVGYGIWGAMVSGIGAGGLTLLGIIGIVRESLLLRKCMLIISVAALVMCLTLLCFGSMTFITVGVAVLLASETVLLYYWNRTG